MSEVVIEAMHATPFEKGRSWCVEKCTRKKGKGQMTVAITTQEGETSKTANNTDAKTRERIVRRSHHPLKGERRGRNKGVRTSATAVSEKVNLL